MDKLLGNIDRQIEFNKGKNFFIDKPNFSLQFMEETRNTIENFGIINEAYENRLIDYSTHKVMDEFCRINQYFSFNNESKVDLRNIYVDLFSNIKMKNVTVDGISNRHYRNLKLWLQKTNPFAEEIYSGKDVILKPVVCAEYSAELQMEILQIDLSKLMEPVLDIGCGKQGELVEFLRSNGFETYGIDRLSFDNSNLMEADWLDFDYGTQNGEPSLVISDSPIIFNIIIFERMEIF